MIKQYSKVISIKCRLFSLMWFLWFYLNDHEKVSWTNCISVKSLLKAKQQARAEKRFGWHLNFFFYTEKEPWCDESLSLCTDIHRMQTNYIYWRILSSRNIRCTFLFYHITCSLVYFVHAHALVQDNYLLRNTYEHWVNIWISVVWLSSWPIAW